MRLLAALAVITLTHLEPAGGQHFPARSWRPQQGRQAQVWTGPGASRASRPLLVHLPGVSSRRGPRKAPLKSRRDPARRRPDIPGQVVVLCGLRRDHRRLTAASKKRGPARQLIAARLKLMPVPSRTLGARSGQTPGRWERGEGWRQPGLGQGRQGPAHVDLHYNSASAREDRTDAPPPPRAASLG